MTAETMLERLVHKARAGELQQPERDDVMTLSKKCFGRFSDMRCLTMEDIIYIESVWATNNGVQNA